MSNVQIDPFKSFTDHSIVTATTAFSLESEAVREREFLLESGKRFQQLDFAKAPWAEVKSKLSEVDWQQVESLAVKVSWLRSGPRPRWKTYANNALVVIFSKPRFA